MAAANVTLSSDTWWTTSTSQGTGDGSSLANRKTIPTEILHLYIQADVTLYVVQEGDTDGLILIGDDAQQKALFGGGSIKTVNSSGVFDTTRTEKLEIRGSASFPAVYIYLSGPYTMLHNTWMGCFASDNSTDTYCVLHSPTAFFNQCTFTSDTGNGTFCRGGYYRNCYFYEGLSTYLISFYDSGVEIWMEDCTITTDQPDIFRTQSYDAAKINIIGDLNYVGSATPRMYLQGSYGAIQVDYYRRAYLKAVDGDSNALNNVYFNAYEATAYTNLPNTSGKTGADGLLKPKFVNATLSGSILCLDRINMYVGTTTMDFDSPTTSTDYGDYTFALMADGYSLTTTTHDFTDGADWGSSGNEQEITLTSSVPDVNSQVLYLATYADGSTADESVTFAPDSNVYFDGAVQLDGACTASSDIITYDSDDNPINTQSGTYTYSAGGASVQLKAFYPLGGRPIWWTETYSAGVYRNKLTITGSGIAAGIETDEYIEIVDTTPPTITNETITPTSMSWGDNVVATCSFANEPTEGAWVTFKSGSTPLYSKEMTINGTSGSVTASSHKIGAGTFSVEFDAVNGAYGASATISAMTVSEAAGSQYKIRTEIYNRILELTASGQPLESFQINKEFPNHDALPKRAVVIDDGPEPETDYGFGNFSMNRVNYEVQTTFDDVYSKVVSGSTYSRQDLSDWMLEQTRAYLEQNLDFEAAGVTLVGRPKVMGAVHREQFTEQPYTVYGNFISIEVPYREV